MAETLYLFPAFPVRFCVHSRNENQSHRSAETLISSGVQTCHNSTLMSVICKCALTNCSNSKVYTRYANKPLGDKNERSLVNRQQCFMIDHYRGFFNLLLRSDSWLVIQLHCVSGQRKIHCNDLLAGILHKHAVQDVPCGLMVMRVFPNSSFSSRLLNANNCNDIHPHIHYLRTIFTDMGIHPEGHVLFSKNHQ